MNTTDRNELCKKLRKQLNELKITLEATLPRITNDIRDLKESEELIDRVTGNSPKSPYDTESNRYPIRFGGRPFEEVNTKICLSVMSDIRNLQSLLEDWETYGETIAKELKDHEQAIQQDIERRIKGN